MEKKERKRMGLSHKVLMSTYNIFVVQNEGEILSFECSYVLIHAHDCVRQVLFPFYMM
jgi:hypothetical protein